MVMSRKEIVDRIAEALQGADGDYLAYLFNRFYTEKIRYRGEGFERIRVSEEQIALARHLGWNVWEIPGIPGAWVWCGAGAMYDDGHFGSEVEAWDHLIRTKELPSPNHQAIGDWCPVTRDLFGNPYFKAFGRDSFGAVFVFWNGGGDWLTRTGAGGSEWEEDLCFPVEWKPLGVEL